MTDNDPKEVYLPLDPSKRDAALAIWEHAARKVLRADPPRECDRADLAAAWRDGAKAQCRWSNAPNSGARSWFVPESENPYGGGS